MSSGGASRVGASSSGVGPACVRAGLLARPAAERGHPDRRWLPEPCARVLYSTCQISYLHSRRKVFRTSHLEGIWRGRPGRHTSMRSRRPCSRVHRLRRCPCRRRAAAVVTSFTVAKRSCAEQMALQYGAADDAAPARFVHTCQSKTALLGSLCLRYPRAKQLKSRAISRPKGAVLGQR